jgi:hypothetical protein
LKRLNLKTAGLAAALLLSACAPAAVRSTQEPPFQASFSESGVLWLEKGAVTLARAPGFHKVVVNLPQAATAVGWQQTDTVSIPWVALGNLGLIVTADARPVSVQVGRAALLSKTRVYRQDGTTVGYDGSGAGSGLLGEPDAVVTGGDGLEYAVQGGKLYRLGGDSQLPNSGQLLLSSAARPLLYATPSGAETANVPTAVTLAGRYQLTGTALERRDAAGVLVSSLPHPAGLIGVVGGEIVTLQPGGRLRFFGPELRELKL